MRKKSLAISNVLMLAAAVFCIAIFGAGAVWAYNANLAMKLPANFTFSSCTLTYSAGSSGTVYSAGAAGAGFTVTPVENNTLEVSTTYQTYGAKTITFSSEYTMSLVNAVAYGVDLQVSNAEQGDPNVYANEYVKYTLGAGTLKVEFLSPVVFVEGDVITFQILFV